MYSLNKTLRFTIFLLIIFFNSCKCDKTFDCPALSDDAQTWLPQFESDTVTFRNDEGKELKFILNSKTISPAYEARACKKGELGCSCDYHCESSGNLFMECDSSIDKTNYYYIRIDESGESMKTYFRQGFRITYGIFDFIKSIDLQNSIQLSSGDSLLSSLTLGNNIYTNVYVFSADTVMPFSTNKRIWKSYYTQKYGVIGFIDRQNQTLYYRKN
ncbi:MAG: hypothetical protein ABI772_10785 [Bacteroidota bacterium]